MPTTNIHPLRILFKAPSATERHKLTLTLKLKGPGRIYLTFDSGVGIKFLSQATVIKADLIHIEPNSVMLEMFGPINQELQLGLSVPDGVTAAEFDATIKGDVKGDATLKVSTRKDSFDQAGNSSQPHTLEL